jgi:hypothetical protein
MKPMLNIAGAVTGFEKIMGQLRGGGGGFSQGGREGGAPEGVEGWADMSPAEKLHAARVRNQTAAR